MCGLHSRAGSVRHQKPCARRSQSHRLCCLHSSVSRHFGGLVYTPALLLQPLQAGAARHLQKLPGAGEAAVPAAGADIVGLCGGQTAKDCAGIGATLQRRCVVPLFVGQCLFAITVLARSNDSARSLFRAVPARAPEAVCLPTFLAVFAGVWEPEVSQTLRRQSPSAAHASRPPPGPALHSLRSFRVLGHWQTHSRHAQSLAHETGSCETASNQGFL